MRIRTEQWRGGDINVDITVTDLLRPETALGNSRPMFGRHIKCLRVAFMYEDGVDRTHAGPDDLDTAVG